MAQLNPKIPLEKPDSDKIADRRAMIGLCLGIVIILIIIWFGRELLVSKSMIVAKEVPGQNQVVLFSQKVGTLGIRDRHDVQGSDGTHYGYFLELFEKGSNSPIHTLKFKSPVEIIKHTPELLVFPDGNIWVVSTTDNYEKESPGFVLKFSIVGNKIKPQQFKIPENYRVRSIQDNKVMLSEGSTPFSKIFPEPLFIELESSRIIDQR
jgi:hypothetical protein